MALVQLIYLSTLFFRNKRGEIVFFIELVLFFYSAFFKAYMLIVFIYYYTIDPKPQTCLLHKILLYFYTYKFNSLILTRSTASSLIDSNILFLALNFHKRCC